MIYLIGSLRNPQVTVVAKQLRDSGFEVFDDWYAAGPEADDMWKEYEIERGHSYLEALSGHAARNVFAFDRKHLDRSEAVVLVLPAGKSGHLELGYSLGRGKSGYILLDNPDRWDVMYQFATKVSDKIEDIIHELRLLRGLGKPTETRRDATEADQVGQEVPRSSLLGGVVEQGPVNPKWCRDCRAGEECAFCWVQRLSPRYAGQ